MPTADHNSFEVFGYATDDQIVSLTDANGNKATTGYDALELLVEDGAG